MDSAGAVEALDEALGALPEKLREPLVVHFPEGLTHAESASLRTTALV